MPEDFRDKRPAEQEAEKEGTKKSKTGGDPAKSEATAPKAHPKPSPPAQPEPKDVSPKITLPAPNLVGERRVPLLSGNWNDKIPANEQQAVLGLRAAIANMARYLSDRLETAMVPRADLVLPEYSNCLEILARSPQERLEQVMTSSDDALTLLKQGRSLLTCPLSTLCSTIDTVGEQLSNANLSVPQVRASGLVLYPLRADGTIQGRGEASSVSTGHYGRLLHHRTHQWLEDRT